MYYLSIVHTLTRRHHLLNLSLIPSPLLLKSVFHNQGIEIISYAYAQAGTGNPVTPQ